MESAAPYLVVGGLAALAHSLREAIGAGTDAGAGESTTLPLADCSLTRVSQIHERLPGARVIVVVMDPAIRAIREFHDLRGRISELRDMTPDEFFQPPWPVYEDVVEQRGSPRYHLFASLRHSRYLEGYVNLAAVFGVDNILVVTLEELRAEPATTGAGIADFLGARMRDPDFAAAVEPGESVAELDPVLLEQLREHLADNYAKFRMYTRRDSAAADRDVLVGQDGWIFLTGGTNSVAAQYQDEPISDPAMQRWVNLLQKRQARAAELGCTYRHLIAPDKLTLYGDQSGLPLGQGSLERLVAFVRERAPELEPFLVDPTPRMRREREHEDMFWRTDSHWSRAGCHVAYQELCRSLGVTPAAEMFVAAPPRVHVRDLGIKFRPVIPEIAVIPELAEGVQRVGSNELVRAKERLGRVNDAGLHVGSSVELRNEAAPHQDCVLIFGDSFSEYRPGLLTYMLAHTFAHVHFYWCTSIDFDIVAEVRPRYLISEIAERFLITVPGDRLDVRKLAREKTAALLAARGRT